MAFKNTYEQVQKRAADYNITMSDWDWDLAEKNPDAGMTILNAKIGYGQATTDEERQKFNQIAEDTRRSAGGFTAGVDGTSYFQVSPTSLDAVTSYEQPKVKSSAESMEETYGSAGSFGAGSSATKNPYAQAAQSASSSKDSYSTVQNAIANFTPREYEAPTRPTEDNPYKSMYAQALENVQNTPEFSYDLNSDPSWNAYRQQYTREGRRATADTLGQYASMTGGMPSTAAVTAASQAGDYYAAQMNDKIPELYQNAYSRYLQQFQQKLQGLNAVRGAYQDSHNAYLDELGQYNTDRNFNYGAYLDDRNYASQLRGELEDQNRYLLDFTENQRLNNWDRDNNNALTLNQTGYQRVLDAYDRGQAAEQQALENQWTERSWDRTRDLDEAAAKQQEWSNTMAERQQTAAETQQAQENQWTEEDRALAQEKEARDRNLYLISILMSAGEFGRLRELYPDLTDEEIATLARQFQLEQAQALASGSGSRSSGGSSRSYSGGGSGTSSATETKPRLTAAQTLTALNNGVVNESTLAAYRYWFGQDYRNPRTSLDHSQDEGTYTWNGKNYASYDDLENDVLKANLSDAELEELSEKIELNRPYKSLSELSPEARLWVQILQEQGQTQLDAMQQETIQRQIRDGEMTEEDYNDILDALGVPRIIPGSRR